MVLPVAATEPLLEIVPAAQAVAARVEAVLAPLHPRPRPRLVRDWSWRYNLARLLWFWPLQLPFCCKEGGLRINGTGSLKRNRRHELGDIDHETDPGQQAQPGVLLVLSTVSVRNRNAIVKYTDGSCPFRFMGHVFVELHQLDHSFHRKKHPFHPGKVFIVKKLKESRARLTITSLHGISGRFCPVSASRQAHSCVPISYVPL